MNPIIRNILAFIGSLFIGGQVNMGILKLGAKCCPPPPGVDINNIESINANIHLYSMTDLMVPFFAHALGTLVGALLVGYFASTHKMRLAMSIGILFFLGGATAVWMIPNAPIWFSALDLIIAYFPMAYLGYWTSNKFSKEEVIKSNIN